MTFLELKEGDRVPVIEINFDDLTIKSRIAKFKKLESFEMGVKFIDRGKEYKTSFYEGKFICYRVSNNLLNDVYYFSDMEQLELFIKDLNSKVDKFKESIQESLKTLWEENDKK